MASKLGILVHISGITLKLKVVVVLIITMLLNSPKILSPIIENPLLLIPVHQLIFMNVVFSLTLVGWLSVAKLIHNNLELI